MIESPVAHRTVDVDGISTFYREAGPPDAPVVLLPHGYPSSSFQFRNLMPRLGDRWRLVAPDLPGFGYTRADRPRFAFTFDAYAEFLERFTVVLGLTRYAIYLQDWSFRTATSTRTSTVRNTSRSSGCGPTRARGHWRRSPST
jgi:pimeloyl-ACP methyl ester carboxylesterase